MNESTTETIGCDLGDKKSELCVLQGTKLHRPKAIATTRAGFKKFFEGRAGAHVVLEVGQHSRWASECLATWGHKVTVANPRKLKLISGSSTKTDRNDAELLARLGRADLELLSPVTHRGAQAQADLAVAKGRDLLVKARARLVNSARGMVKSFGQRLSACTAESFHRRTFAEIPEALKPALAPMYVALQTLEDQIKGYEKTLVSMGQRYPDVKVIGQPNGVGLLTSLVFLLTLEDKGRFKNSRSVGAFVGVVPRKDQSGATDKQLQITKTGDAFLRRLLVQCANYVLGPFGKDSDLRRWGLELAKRGGANGRKRAKVAVARKLAVLMHRLWVTGEIYEPLRQAKKAEAKEQTQNE